MTLPPLSDYDRCDIAALLRELTPERGWDSAVASRYADLLDPPQPDLLDRMHAAAHEASAGVRQCNAARLRVVADWLLEQGRPAVAEALRAEADKETP